MRKSQYLRLKGSANRTYEVFKTFGEYFRQTPSHARDKHVQEYFFFPYYCSLRENPTIFFKMATLSEPTHEIRGEPVPKRTCRFLSRNNNCPRIPRCQLKKRIRLKSTGFPAVLARFGGGAKVCAELGAFTLGEGRDGRAPWNTYSFQLTLDKKR